AFAELGLLSNPDDFSLHNNLAFALALKGDGARAQEVLGVIGRMALSPVEHVVFTATSGLVSFRLGNSELGRRHYHRAVELGKRLPDPRVGVIARVYCAFEEIRVRSPQSERIRQEAVEQGQTLADPLYLAVVDRLRRFQPQ